MIKYFDMEICFVMTLSWQCVAVGVELPDYPDDVNSGIPVNYTEAKVGEYTLPDLLVTNEGEPVRNAAEWYNKRRPELLRIVAENQFGRAPGKPAAMQFDVFEKSGSAFDGKAIRRQVTIRIGEGAASRAVELLIYLPANATGPVPLLLNISFMANNLTVNDDEVKQGWVWDREHGKRVPAEKGRWPARLPVLPTLDRGLAIATFNYTDVDPDAPGALHHGVRQLYLTAEHPEPAANEWGTISAWAWGISRIVDYFETDADVDAKRIAITGVSRLGKTVLWAGANDTRIAAVIASCSGEGGAALGRRNYGETIAHMSAPTRYFYQFAANYHNWSDDPNQAPMDSHMILALIAPRPLLLQTGTTDKWSDPKGEFLAAIAATPVYELLGAHGIADQPLPPAGQLVGDTLAYYMHEGGHGLVPGDWDVYLDFLEKQLGE